MIDRATIERIKDAADIVDVVSDFVSLKKVGANYRGLCPFHNDHSPSFYVSPSRRTCHCFVCGEGGDSVGFIMKHEQMTYPDALRWLANRYHIEIQERELTDDQRQEQNDRESMFVVNEWAANYFKDILHNDIDGRAIGMQYFRQRGIRDDIMEKFRLGFCLPQRSAMSDAALSKGFKGEYLKKVGLAYPKNSDQAAPDDKEELIDRFSGRAIFPWIGVSGKVVAFGGRVLDSRTKGVNQKYVNSPESVIYHKDQELYGIFQAKKAIAKESLVYMVEGYTDVISMHQCGIENVVANSGTALSEHQIHMLHRFTSNIVLLYDGDAAGIKAAIRGTKMLLKEGMNTKIMLLPDGKDPDEFAKTMSADEFRAYIKEHQMDFITFMIKVKLDGVTDAHERSEGVTEIVKMISLISDPITRAAYLQDCANRLGFSEQTLTARMNQEISNLREEERKAETRRQNNGEGAAVAQTPDAATQQTPTNSQNATGYAPAETNSQPQGNYTATASPAATANRPRGTTAIRETVADLLIKLVILHGADTVLENVESEDGTLINLNVAQYIDYSLAQDNMQFSLPIYNNVLREAVEHSADEGFNSESYFTLHPDYDISTLAIRLTQDVVVQAQSESEETKVVKYSKEQLLDKTEHLLLDFRYQYINLRLTQLRQEIASAKDTPERLLKLMAEMQEAQKLRTMISKKIGSCLR